MRKSTDMKKKKLSQKTFTPMSAVVAGCALAAVGVQAQPLFDATFPASWNGTSTTVVDQSSAANIGFQSGTATYSTSVPAGGTGGSMTLTGAGGIKVTGNSSYANADALLNNPAVASAGGFSYDIDFEWNGATATTQKLVDYSGTESLQLDGATGVVGMSFGGDTGSAPDGNVVTTTILPNTWYDITMTFNTGGAPLVCGNITGIASLYVNGILVSSAAATKGTYGDSLDRPIAIGELGYGHVSSYVGLDGSIYDASVDLGVVPPVPEPSSLVLGALSGLSTIGVMWNNRRRKS